MTAATGGPAGSAWSTLEEPWQAAISQAWESWCCGSAGVGACLTDASGVIVARGRNRMGEPAQLLGRASGTIMAHAEMDLLSQVPLGTRPSGILYTTFEPCLMCASTMLVYNVKEMRYAAADPVFDGLHDWFATYPFTAERAPKRSCLGGPVGAFCHVLHLSWLLTYPVPDRVISPHRRLAPGHLACAADVVDEHRLRDLAEEGAGAEDAMAELWPSLVRLAR